jgi:hypothetical protein
MAEKLLTEQFAFTGGKVRRPGVDGFTGKYPVIEDSLLCGPTSLNARDYPGSAFGDSANKLYEGRPIFVNHSDKERQFQEKLGWIENERRRSDGMPIGNIAIIPTHPLAESVLWAAENKPDFAGFSHVARCDTTVGANGRESIRKVLKVESTDLVVDPATTKGFFESKRTPMAKITLKTLAERVGPKLGDPAKWSRLKKLFEMDGVPADLQVEEPAADASPDTSIKDAFQTLAAAIIADALEGKITPEDAGGKITEFLKTHLGNEEKPADGGGDAAESKKRTGGGGDLIAEALDVCEKLGFRATREELEIIGAVPAARREQIAKRLKVASEGAAGTATSGGRSRAQRRRHQEGIRPGRPEQGRLVTPAPPAARR